MGKAYKREIAQLVEAPSWGGLFRVPAAGSAREYPLVLPDGTGKADFCYDLGQSGKLFIEDDDDARALANLVKYWRWCLEHPEQRPVHLVHIIGAVSGLQIGHCCFLKTRMERDLAKHGFRYHLITIDGWDAPEKCLPKLREVLDAVSREVAGEATAGA